MKNILKKNFFDVGRFKVHKRTGYKIHRGLVKIMSVLLLCYLSLSFFWALSHDRYYISCDEVAPCENPLYGASCKGCGIPQELFTMDYLPPGYESGYKAPAFFVDAPVYSLLLLFLGAAFNHSKYNKSFILNNRGDK